jgi:phage terminase small subunit
MVNVTAKQARFVDEYLVDGNGTAAAIRAGYGRAGARVAAHRALRNANVAALIAARQAADSQRLRVQRDDVLRGLLAAVETAKTQANPVAQIAAWREIAKMLGFYAPERVKMELGASAAAELRRLEAMSDDELLTLAAGG